MSRNAINLTFPITPKAKQSFRISKHGHHKDPAVEKYQESIKAMALAQTKPSQRNQSGMLFVSVEFVYSWPKTWAKGRLAKAQESICYRIARPDVDNLCKGVFDALNGLIWVDDSQIVAIHAWKRYGYVDAIIMRVWPADGNHLTKIPPE
jgi:Holliday junction resolvase RusA-like endonuclease